jgi:NADH dehydrogenase
VATNGRTVTVFGGTGFLGRRIVRHLRYREFAVRIASRHPDRGHRLFGPDDPQLQSVEANIHDERSAADALAGAYGAVNAVSLYLERGETFHSVHVESARRVAAQAHRAGVKRLEEHDRWPTSEFDVGYALAVNRTGEIGNLVLVYVVSEFHSIPISRA